MKTFLSLLKKNIVLLIFYAIAVAYLVLTSGSIQEKFGISEMAGLVLLLLSLTIISMPFWFKFYNDYKSKDNEDDKSNYIDSLRDKLITDIDMGGQIDRGCTHKDILELMIENMSEIREYFKISKEQTRKSFFISIISCVVGIFLLMLSVVLSFAFNRLDVTIITAIAGSMTELFAGTVLLVYRQSLKQLNLYYNALHENEKFLSSVNLINKITPEKQDEVYIAVIKNEFKDL